MNKPEKKEERKRPHGYGWYVENKEWNEACDEYEKFLPTEEELFNILVETLGQTVALTAKVISKRIGGEK